MEDVVYMQNDREGIAFLCELPTVKCDTVESDRYYQRKLNIIH